MIYISQAQLAIILLSLDKRSEWIANRLRSPKTPDKPALSVELSEIRALQHYFAAVEPEHSTVVLIQPRKE